MLYKIYNKLHKKDSAANTLISVILYNVCNMKEWASWIPSAAPAACGCLWCSWVLVGASGCSCCACGCLWSLVVLWMPPAAPAACGCLWMPLAACGCSWMPPAALAACGCSGCLWSLVGARGCSGCSGCLWVLVVLWMPPAAPAARGCLWLLWLLVGIRLHICKRHPSGHATQLLSAAAVSPPNQSFRVESTNTIALIISYLGFTIRICSTERNRVKKINDI